nr:MAG TPA: hypothetical protein [Caudoviricetes sp.]
MPIYLLSPSTILVVEVIIKLKNMIDKNIEEVARFDDKEYYDRLSDNDRCFFEYGFRRGYNRALKDLLHPANEIPKEFNHYGFAALYILQYNRQIKMVLYDKDNMSWKNVIGINEYWFYVDDILPKKGGEQ